MQGFKNKTYITRMGTEITPRSLSECERFVFADCLYTDGRIMKKWFWANHRIFKNPTK